MICNRCKRNGEICCRLGWTYAASVLVMRWLYFWVRLRSALLWFQLILLSFFLLQTFEICPVWKCWSCVFSSPWLATEKTKRYQLCVKAIELTSLHTSCIEFVWTSKRWSSERASTLCVATRVCYSIFVCVRVCVGKVRFHLVSCDLVCILVASRNLRRNWDSRRLGCWTL